jgi:hypothetical protein
MPGLHVQGILAAVALTEKSPDEGKTINVELHSENDFPADHREQFSLQHLSTNGMLTH